jgi:hypothetical protein
MAEVDPTDRWVNDRIFVPKKKLKVNQSNPFIYERPTDVITKGMHEERKYDTFLETNKKGIEEEYEDELKKPPIHGAATQTTSNWIQDLKPKILRRYVRTDMRDELADALDEDDIVTRKYEAECMNQLPSSSDFAGLKPTAAFDLELAKQKFSNIALGEPSKNVIKSSFIDALLDATESLNPKYDFDSNYAVFDTKKRRFCCPFLTEPSGGNSVWTKSLVKQINKYVTGGISKKRYKQLMTYVKFNGFFNQIKSFMYYKPQTMQRLLKNVLSRYNSTVDRDKMITNFTAISKDEWKKIFKAVKMEGKSTGLTAEQAKNIGAKLQKASEQRALMRKQINQSVYDSIDLSADKAKKSTDVVVDPSGGKYVFEDDKVKWNSTAKQDVASGNSNDLNFVNVSALPSSAKGKGSMSATTRKVLPSTIIPPKALPTEVKDTGPLSIGSSVFKIKSSRKSKSPVKEVKEALGIIEEKSVLGTKFSATGVIDGSSTKKKSTRSNKNK